MIVISNTSPITSLAAIGYLNLLHDIYGTILIPVAVYEEITGLGYAVPGTIEVQTLSWIEKRELKDRLLLEELQKELSLFCHFPRFNINKRLGMVIIEVNTEFYLDILILRSPSIILILKY